MKLNELNSSLSISNNNNINDQLYRQILEISFSQLIDLESVGINTLHSSKPDVIKELNATFLTCIAEFGRNNYTKENVKLFLIRDCNFPQSRADVFADLYESNKLRLFIKLGNIGTHLPHIVDVNWKIDYIIKTSNLDEAEGPIFRVNFVTEKFDRELNAKKTENIKFSCNSQELQDLVYKLKDAVRHCQKIGTEH